MDLLFSIIMGSPDIVAFFFADSICPVIKALYVENLGIVKRMCELHSKLRSLSLDNATCPDSERSPLPEGTHRHGQEAALQ